MVAIHPALEPARASEGQRGRALPGQSIHRARREQILRSTLAPSARLVALAIAHFSADNPKAPRLWASVATLADATGLAPSTVKRAIARLVRLGFLVRDPDRPSGRAHKGPEGFGPVWYLVRFDALPQRPAKRRTEPPPMGHHDPCPMGHHDPQAEAEESRKTSEAGRLSAVLSPQPPFGGPAAEGQEGQKTEPRWGPKSLSGIAAAKRGLQEGATPPEDAHAALRSMGFRPSMIEDVAECWGPEDIADVRRTMFDKRRSGKPIANFAGLALTILKREHPEGAARYAAKRLHGGHRGARRRARDPFALGTVDLGEGLAPSTLQERTQTQLAPNVPANRLGELSSAAEDRLIDALHAKTEGKRGKAALAIWLLNGQGWSAEDVARAVEQAPEDTEDAVAWAKGLLAARREAIA